MSSTINENPSNDKQINIISIISLALGIFGWSINIIGAIIISSAYLNGTLFEGIPIILSSMSWLAAIITGFIGMKQIKANASEKGKGLAISGIIVGGIGLIDVLSVFLKALLLLYVMSINS